MIEDVFVTPALRRRGADRIIGQARSALGRPYFNGHAPRIAAFGVIAVWLCRRALFTGAIPAGTDALGFVTRARQNATVSELTSPWAPSSLGAIRQFTLDNLLGGLTLITRDPLVTVKLLILLVLFTTGASAYALSWRWYRSKSAATFAGLFFMLSQAALTRWGSGELNVEIAIALTPLVLLAWDACLRRATVRRLAILALELGLIFLVRPDMILYAVPFLAVHALVRLALSPRASATAVAAMRATALVAPALALLLAAQAVPLLFGVRASWLTTGSLFSSDDFAQRSLDAYPSLLGFGREIGYLAFTGQQTWYSHPWLPSVLYELLASVLLLAGLSALWKHRGARSLSLGLSIAFGAFLAKGIRAPLGEPYMFAVRHLPVFGNLRDPNRWLIVPALAVAVLAGLTYAHGRRVLLRRVSDWPYSRVLVAFASLATIALLLIPVGPTLVRGFMTWRPSGNQVELMKRVARDRSQFAVATIPYDQTYHFLSKGPYRGYEHDLGAESATFTGHPALADGGWAQPTASFVSFTNTLLRRHDPAFAQLLATAGVKYLLDFSYPETAPHLLPSSLLSRPHGPTAGTLHQQQAWLAMGPPPPLARNRAGGVYQLPHSSPPLSFRTNLAVVFGGLSSTAALADLPGVNLENWAVVQSDDVVTQGLPRLLALIRSATLLVLGDDSLNATAILATPAVVDIPGVTSNPDLEHLTQLLTLDQSARDGNLANQTLPPSVSGTHRAATTFSLSRPQDLQLWVRAEASRSAARLVFRLDGHEVGSFTPVALETGPMVWHRVGTFTLAAGRHTFSASAGASRFGDSYEVDEMRFVDRKRLEDARRRLVAAVKGRAAHLIVSLDASSLPLGLGDRSFYTATKTITSSPSRFWSLLENNFARRTPTENPHAPLIVRVSGGRRLYTIAQHAFTKPQDWRRRDYLFLQFSGTANGSTYHLFVDFNRRHSDSAEYTLPDSGEPRQVVAISTPDSHDAIPAKAWHHVVSVRVTSDSRDVGGLLTLGSLRISGRIGRVTVRHGVPCALRRHVLSEAAGLRAHRYPCALSLTVDPRSDGALRLTEGSPIRERIPTRVTYRRTGATSYTFAVRSRAPGWLVLDQSFDPHWILRTDGLQRVSTPLYSTVNGFPIPPGSHVGTVSLSGSGAASAGVVISGLSAIALIGLAVADPALSRSVRRRRRRPRRRATWALAPMPRRSPSFWTGCLAVAAAVAAGRSIAVSAGLGVLILVVYRIRGWMCLASAALLIAVTPFVEMVRPIGANALAVDVTALLVIAVTLFLLEERRRFARSSSVPQR
ncbi:MAG TPA: hypothetical protein VE984_08655 [Gaiellaceae bacterium]|nr:hypothetical protein [Gaiellaceae bacterium]